MFKLASLIAIAAAADTAAQEKSKAEANLAKANAKLGKSLKTGSSKIGKLFTMPHITADAPTYEELVDKQNNDLTGLDSLCNQCVLAGGKWTEAVNDESSCVIGAPKIAALKKAATSKTNTAGTNVAAAVDADVTYKAMFDGIEKCNGWAKVDKASQVAAYKEVNFKSTNKDAKLAQDAESTASALGKKDTVQSIGSVGTDFLAGPFQKVKTESWKINWDAESTSNWGQARIIMPHSYSGGMYMSLVNDTHTNVAIKVQGTLNRYFDGQSAIASNIGKTDKFPLLTADAIEVIMQQKSTWTTALNTAKPFSITYTRASITDIAAFTAEHGGAVVWIIVGVVVVLACIVGCVCYKMEKCMCGKKKDDSDKFYAVEDCYARV